MYVCACVCECGGRRFRKVTDFTSKGVIELHTTSSVLHELILICCEIILA